MFSNGFFGFKLFGNVCWQLIFFEQFVVHFLVKLTVCKEVPNFFYHWTSIQISNSKKKKIHVLKRQNSFDGFQIALQVPAIFLNRAPPGGQPWQFSLRPSLKYPAPLRLFISTKEIPKNSTFAKFSFPAASVVMKNLNKETFLVLFKTLSKYLLYQKFVKLNRFCHSLYRLYIIVDLSVLTFFCFFFLAEFCFLLTKSIEKLNHHA